MKERKPLAIRIKTIRTIFLRKKKTLKEYIGGQKDSENH